MTRLLPGLLHSRWFRRDSETYKGLRDACAPGTHQWVVEALAAHATPLASVLDLGAGTGALLLRLRDAGFRDLHGADLATANYGLPDVPYTRVDLNGPFASGFTRTFDVVCLSEVLEHLDSPRNALREARKLLSPDGLLVLTMPNVAFWEGRIKFLLTGELWGFGEANHRSIRHVSPMTRDALRLTLQEIGFQVVASGTAGSFATPIRKALFSPLWLPLAAIGGRNVFGECTALVGRKAAPDGALATPTAYEAVWEEPDAPPRERVGVTDRL